MSKSLELRNQRAAIVAQSRQLIDKAEVEKRELTSEEEEKYQKMMADVDSLAKDIAKNEKREQVESLEAETKAVERKGKPLSTRNAFELDENAYREAFRAWCLRGSEKEIYDSDTIYKAAQCGFNLNSNEISMRALSKASNGANTVPVLFANEFEKKLAYYSPFRSFCRTLTTEKGEDYDFPTGNDTAQKAVIVDEAASLQTSTSPTLSKVTLKAFKWSSKIESIPVELLEDNAINLESLLGDMFAERMARGQNEQFVLGDGTTEPEGLAVFATAGANLASGNAMDADKLIDVVYSVDRAYRINGGWLTCDTNVAAVRKLKDDVGNYIWQPGLQSGEPDRILGYPVLVDNNVTSINSPGDNQPLFIFGDMRRYMIRDVGAIRFRRLTELYAENDKVGFVLIKRTDGRVIGHSGCFKSLNSYDS